jgi:hypothetical protein
VLFQLWALRRAAWMLPGDVVWVVGLWSVGVRHESIDPGLIDPRIMASLVHRDGWAWEMVCSGLI